MCASLPASLGDMRKQCRTERVVGGSRLEGSGEDESTEGGSVTVLRTVACTVSVSMITIVS